VEKKQPNSSKMRAFRKELVISYLTLKITRLDGEIKLRQAHVAISSRPQDTLEIIEELLETKLAYLEAIEYIRQGEAV
jgi:hypothetical protein